MRTVAGKLLEAIPLAVAWRFLDSLIERYGLDTLIERAVAALPF